MLNEKVIDYIKDDNSIWESDVLPVLVKEKNLISWEHNKFWQPMDTLREKNILEKLWTSGNAPWKVW